ncbi:unnamed protein product, partial [Mesorhabditis spiculigera]
MEAEQILPVLSITAIISTISLFFTGFPICWEIWKRGGTKDISGMPFIMGLVGASFWLRYGFLRSDSTMITVNVVGVSLFTIYSIFYLFMSQPKKSFGIMLLFTVSLISLMVFLVMQYGIKTADVLGFACMTFNIGCFAAPLAGMKVVLRTRCCDTLPLPMCVANLAVSSQWMLYGTLINDIYVISPNLCGVILSLIQLTLFLIFPMKPGGRAPLQSCCPCIQAPEKPIHDDIEKGGIVPEKALFSPQRQHEAILDMEKKLEGESVVPLLTEKDEKQTRTSPSDTIDSAIHSTSASSSSGASAADLTEQDHPYNTTTQPAQ